MASASENINVELHSEDGEFYSVRVKCQSPHFEFSLHDLEEHSSQKWSQFLTAVQQDSDDFKVVYLHGDRATLFFNHPDKFTLEMTVSDFEVTLRLFLDKDSGIEMVKKIISALQEHESIGTVNPDLENYLVEQTLIRNLTHLMK